MKRLISLFAAVAAVVAGAWLTAPPAVADNASNGFPYCANGSASDPDGDGWGWENSQSCIVRGSRADPGLVLPACPTGTTCGSYQVGGLGGRKQQVRNAGGNVLDLAVAMLEAENMGTNYAYGDNKTNDSANFGIFKQNWLMMRSACSQFAGQSTSQWNNGSALNSNLSQDVTCLHQSQNHYGLNTWFAGHRNGAAGLSNPNTADINAYHTAVNWIRDRLTSSSVNLTNDTRYWVNVPPI
jgi:hypothetical protein